jgi:signal transduction histidine kinase
MTLHVRELFGMPVSEQASWMRLGLLSLSFASLIIFGLRVLRPQERRLTWKDISAGAALLIFYLLSTGLITLTHWGIQIDWVSYADALARYTLAVPGAALAALALHRQSRQAYTENRSALGFNLGVAAYAFAAYCLTQIFVSPLDVFPANFLNASVFFSLTGIPIQIVRAALAVIETVSLIRASQAVEDERERQFLAAQRARLEALEQVQRELVEREALRRELLRHTVIAQEEERARIARELHDESAQFLTALRLNLATLQGAVPKDRVARELIDRLQDLSRKMSQGIYRMVHDLRPAQLDDLGLVAALQYLVDEHCRSAGLEVTLKIDGARQRLDSILETVLFRIAQESLANVARHAGCGQAVLQLNFAPQQVTLRVTDQGIGFNLNTSYSPPHGWGLAGMRERAESVGGQFNLQSSPGCGTMVEVIIPLSIQEFVHGDHPLNAG